MLTALSSVLGGPWSYRFRMSLPYIWVLPSDKKTQEGFLHCCASYCSEFQEEELLASLVPVHLAKVCILQKCMLRIC